MPYVHRTALGEIDSLHREALPGAAEFLASSHPDVLRFVSEGVPTDFHLLDAEFVRVLEDLIDTLVAKKLIALTDMPEPSQAKMNERKRLRDRMSGSVRISV